MMRSARNTRHPSPASTASGSSQARSARPMPALWSWTWVFWMPPRGCGRFQIGCGSMPGTWTALHLRATQTCGRWTCLRNWPGCLPPAPPSGPSVPPAQSGAAYRRLALPSPRHPGSEPSASACMGSSSDPNRLWAAAQTPGSESNHLSRLQCRGACASSALELRVPQPHVRWLNVALK